MNATNIFENSILRQQLMLYDQLGKLLEEGTKVALLDFPNHNNVGDNAIWLGEKVALREIGVSVVYQCDLYSFSEKVLRKRLGKDGVILLHGGGNLGTVWPEHQKFRERIIKLFPDVKIVQLPQSVHFKEDASRLHFGNVAKAHENFHILVRDRASLQILEELDLQVELCPDMAFAMGSVAVHDKPVVDVLWLSRSDHESTGQEEEALSLSMEKLDWLYGEPGRFYSKVIMKFTVRTRRIVQKAFQKSAFLRDYVWQLNSSFFDLLAQSRFNRGVRILSRGSVVVTDRLHGHIISTLLGKPQVLLDNDYRKIGNYLDCFSPSLEAVFYIGNEKLGISEATGKALEIVENTIVDE